MEIDPVCGMEVDPRNAEYTSEYKGQSYYFCSFDCKKTFDQEPEAFTNPDHTAPDSRA